MMMMNLMTQMKQIFQHYLTRRNNNKKYKRLSQLLQFHKKHQHNLQRARNQKRRERGAKRTRSEDGVKFN